jgi:3-hydroxybutyryl-CoA dehydrogenase
VEPLDVRHVGVVGCGLMGSGIVEVVARTGSRVTFLEADDVLVERGWERIRSSTDRAVAKAKLAADERDGLLGRIDAVTDVEGLASVDLVVEAATEDLDAKLGLFRALDGVVRTGVVLASNTSSIPIGSLAAATGRPDRVIGIHFFNPPPQMPLVELIAADVTSEDTYAFAQGWATSLGKTTVRSKDVAGFIVNRLLIPYLNDAAALLDQGVATREDIDTAIRLGLAHPMGPLTLADLIGIDTVVHIANILHEAFGDERYAPHPSLLKLLGEGKLGRKSGAGFYEYGDRG